jgi:type III secretion protein L
VAGLRELTPLGYRLAAGPHLLGAEETGAIEVAGRLIAAAEARAEEIVRDAEEQRRLEAERGFRDGIAEGQRAALARLLMEQAALDAGLRAVEQDLVAVTTAAVRRLVGSFDDRARVETVIRSALGQMRREKRAQVRVGPAHVAHVREAVSELIKAYPEVELVDVVEDPSFDGGRVAVETSIGRVEADIGERLGSLIEALSRAAASQKTP